MGETSYRFLSEVSVGTTSQGPCTSSASDANVSDTRQIIYLDDPADDIDFVTLHNILYFISVLFNYGSLDLFAVVDLGLTSPKRGRFSAMLRRERLILDQVQVRSILRLRLPEMIARKQIKPELQEEMPTLSRSPCGCCSTARHTTIDT